MLYNWDLRLLYYTLHLDSSQIYCNVSLDDVDNVAKPYELVNYQFFHHLSYDLY